MHKLAKKRSFAVPTKSDEGHYKHKYFTKTKHELTKHTHTHIHTHTHTPTHTKP